MDINNTGKVLKNEFIEYIYKKSNENQNKSLFSEIYEMINNELISKSERIILKLKRIMKKISVLNDKESEEDIEW